MEGINQALFLWLNAPADPSRLSIEIALFFAEYFIWLIPATIALGWLRGGERTRKALIEASLAALIGLCISQLIGLTWMHPRPFVIGLGHTFLAHAADPSLPSDHLTLWWSAAFALLLPGNLPRLGAALALLGLPVAWARIYVGVHFPFDMVGALAVSFLSVVLTRRLIGPYLSLIYRPAILIHGWLFGKFIALGWVRR
jgi:undecaprenyl-diphosphatase